MPDSYSNPFFMEQVSHWILKRETNSTETHKNIKRRFEHSILIHPHISATIIGFLSKREHYIVCNTCRLFRAGILNYYEGNEENCKSFFRLSTKERSIGILGEMFIKFIRKINGERTDISQLYESRVALLRKRHEFPHAKAICFTSDSLGHIYGESAWSKFFEMMANGYIMKANINTIRDANGDERNREPEKTVINKWVPLIKTGLRFERLDYMMISGSTFADNDYLGFKSLDFLVGKYHTENIHGADNDDNSRYDGVIEKSSRERRRDRKTIRNGPSSLMRQNRMYPHLKTLIFSDCEGLRFSKQSFSCGHNNANSAIDYRGILQITSLVSIEVINCGSTINRNSVRFILEELAPNVRHINFSESPDLCDVCFEIITSQKLIRSIVLRKCPSLTYRSLCVTDRAITRDLIDGGKGDIVLKLDVITDGYDHGDKYKKMQESERGGRYDMKVVDAGLVQESLRKWGHIEYMDLSHNHQMFAIPEDRLNQDYSISMLPASIKKLAIAHIDKTMCDRLVRNVIMRYGSINLRHLDISHCNHSITDETISLICGTVGFQVNMKSLAVDCCAKLTDRSLVSISKLKSLRILYANGNPNITLFGIVGLLTGKKCDSKCDMESRLMLMKIDMELLREGRESPAEMDDVDDVVDDDDDENAIESPHIAMPQLCTIQVSGCKNIKGADLPDFLWKYRSYTGSSLVISFRDDQWRDHIEKGSFYQIVFAQ